MNNDTASSVIPVKLGEPNAGEESSEYLASKARYSSASRPLCTGYLCGMELRSICTV